MALNLATLKTRSLTAAIFVVVMLTGLLWNQWSFFVLFSFIHFGCWGEYQRLIGLIDPGYAKITPFHKYGVRVAGWSVLLYFTNDALQIGGLSLQVLGWWLGLLFVFVLPLAEILLVRDLSWKNIGYSALGLLYISLSWGLLTNIRCLFPENLLPVGSLLPIGKLLVLLTVGSIWINDTMAYIVGSMIGKTPLSAISPKKTWEGTIGGIILAIVVMGAAGHFLDYHYRDDGDGGFNWAFPVHCMTIAAISSVAGTFGDLLESKLKRMAGVKDSGSIMPGHGGFLDRFDSLLLATPFVWLYVFLFLK
ncbi:MAG: phosphatidate cytidylyltransferase [Puia sp.]|nr:phosphatidate cytidylyltransferase [Puia sp.]